MTKLSSEETEAKGRIPRFWNTNFQEKSQQMELGPNPQRLSPQPARKSHLNPDIALWFQSVSPVR